MHGAGKEYIWSRKGVCKEYERRMLLLAQEVIQGVGTIVSHTPYIQLIHYFKTTSFNLQRLNYLYMNRLIDFLGVLANSSVMSSMAVSF